MFEITTEPARRLVRLKLNAMLTREQVAELYRQEHAAITAMNCPLGEHYCIVDLTSCPLQLQEVAQAFQSEIGSYAKAKKLAMFTWRQSGECLQDRPDGLGNIDSGTNRDERYAPSRDPRVLKQGTLLLSPVPAGLFWIERRLKVKARLVMLH